MAEPSEDRLSAIKSEIGLIAWKELSRFFAQGTAISIHIELDLADVALQFSLDNTAAVSAWLQEGKVARVSDELARTWFEADATVRAIVVNPWVLVQAAGEN